MSRYASLPWHTMSVDALEKTLKTDRYSGLTHKLARKRRERVGENTLFSPVRSTFTDACLTVLRDAPMMLLLLVCIVALCFSMWREVLCVLCVAIVSILLTLTAHIKTRRIRESMSGFSIPTVELIRAGKGYAAHATTLVPGDVIRLKRGDRVPADARLIWCDEHFRVRTLRALENGVPTYEPETVKNAGMLYEDGTDASDKLLRENMIFAGSLISDGGAMALVVATGEDTYHGALSGAHALTAKIGEMPYLTWMRRYVNRYSLFMCAMLLLSTILGLLFSEELALFDVFLIVLALAVASLSEQLMVIGRIVAACGVIRAALPWNRNAAAVFKEYTVSDRVGRIRHLFLTDLRAITDGVWHPYAIFTDEKMFDTQSFYGSSVMRFYTLAYLYAHCVDGAMIREDGTMPSLSELIRASRDLVPLLSFDTESLEIRMLSAERATDGSGDALVSLRMRGGSSLDVRIVCSTDESLLSSCNGRTVGDAVLPMDEDALALLREVCRRLRNDGCCLLLYATRNESGMVFEGLIALREGVDVEAAEKLAGLARHHVRVSFLLSEPQPYELALLSQCGLLTDEALELHLPPALTGRELYRWYDKQPGCVLTNVTAEDAARLIDACHRVGSCCAVAAAGYEHYDLMDAADVAISYDDTPFRSDGVINAGKPMPMEDYHAGHQAMRADAAMLARADLLVHRGGENGGATDGLLGAIRAARAIEKNMALMLQYMLVTQFLRMTPVLLSLLFGKVVLSAPLILIGGLWVDLGFILLLAFRRGGEEELLTPARSGRLFESPIRERPDRVCAAVLSGLIILLLCAMLRTSRLFAADGARELFVYLSLVTVQTTAILLFYFSGSERDSRPLASQIPVLGMLVFILLTPLLLLCFPGVAALLGCDTLTLPILAIAMLFALIYSALCYLFAALRFKVQRTLRRYFRK